MQERIYRCKNMTVNGSRLITYNGLPLGSVIDNKSEIARTLNIGIATVHRYLSEGWKPFETKARYFSDFIRNKEWFYGI